MNLTGNDHPHFISCRCPACHRQALQEGHNLERHPTTESGWECPSCHQPNNPTTSVCSGCGTRRDPKPLSAEAAAPYGEELLSS